LTAALKRNLKILLLTATVVALGSGCFVVPQSGMASEPANTPAVQPTSTATTITSDPKDATIGKYGTRTSATFTVKATGSKLRYTWQRKLASGSWKSISSATKASYVAKASTWKNGSVFRVVVKGDNGTVTSKSAKLTVLSPTKTPAADAEKAFGLTGLTQGVDLSAYQYTPAGRVNLKAIATWTTTDGFTILRTGSGARPKHQTYVSACTNKTEKTGATPVTEDCAYAKLADAATASKLSLGHYWFNGWITSIDTTKKNLFSGDYTTADSARQFVKWLKADGHYTKSSTDPLVLDIEKGHAWVKTYKGKKYTMKLRAWNADEATNFLVTVKSLLTDAGYHPNLYVYMSANAAARLADDGAWYWGNVAGLARLWVASWGTNNGRVPDAQPKVGPWVNYGGWSIWQYTSNAHIAGSGVGGVDADIAQADAWTVR